VSNAEFIIDFTIQHSTFSISRGGCAMPQELLRDVLRTGDSTGQVRRRLSVVPVSIAAHVVAVIGFVTAPLVTGVDPPSILSPLKIYVPVVMAAPPPPPVPSTPNVAPRPNAAPTEAPSVILTTEPRPSTPPGVVGVDGGENLGVDQGAGVLADANVSAPPIALPPPPETPKVVRVGSGIREPRKLVHVPPVYPVIAQQARIQGAVTLEALIDVTGRVQNVKVLRTDSPLLDAAAVQAVQQWRYSPTELNGVPVPVLMTIFVRFTLER
jgi:periplasmic protein TonB